MTRRVHYGVTARPFRERPRQFTVYSACIVHLVARSAWSMTLDWNEVTCAKCLYSRAQDALGIETSLARNRKIIDSAPAPTGPNGEIEGRYGELVLHGELRWGTWDEFAEHDAEMRRRAQKRWR